MGAYILSEYFYNIYDTIKTMVSGMSLTLHHLRKKKDLVATLQYPNEKWPQPDRNIGFENEEYNVIRSRLHVDIDDCIGCLQCERACPVDCIKIDTIKPPKGSEYDCGKTSFGTQKKMIVQRFTIDMSECMYCNLCVYPCPEECIYMVGGPNESKHEIISDRIVAGTYIIAAVMLNSEFEVKNIKTEHIESLTVLLKKMGANLIVNKDAIKILPSNNLKGTFIETAPYPGFPTDLQAQIMALMSIVKGDSVIKETIFENRFMHVPELNRLGADIKINKQTAFIKGNREFKGAQVMASDLRASVSLVLAAMCASGETTINRVYHLDRGYEKIEEKLGKCGPIIKRQNI